MGMKSRIRSMLRRPVYVSVGQLTPGKLLNGKRIVITGGGSGIGKEIARAAVRQGATVLITGRKEEKLQKAVAELSMQEGAVDYLVWDICDHADMTTMLTKIEQKMGGVLIAG